MERITLPDVLTFEEASAYLRLPIEAVLRQALQLPASNAPLTPVTNTVADLTN